jgi:uncharacterized protein YegL
MGTFVKRSNRVHVLMILDMSGSMAPQWDDTIGGANSYFEGLKKDENTDYRVTIINFDTAYEVLCSDRPLAEVPKLDRMNYRPRGGTTLYDAVGRAIRETEVKVLDGEKAVVVIITDGEENSSHEETQSTIKPKIEILQGRGNWTFVYLGAVANAWLEASKMGIGLGNTVKFNKRHTKGLYANMVGATMSYSADSSRSASVNFVQDYGQNLADLDDDDE